MTIRDSMFVCNRVAPCIFSVGPGVNVTWDIDQATRDASHNILWIDNGMVSSNLILNGVVVFETEKGVLKQQITTPGDLTVGQNAILELFFDTLPQSVNIDSFFDIGGTLDYDRQFDGDNIRVFVDDPSMVGDLLAVSFQGDGNDTPQTLNIVSQSRIPPPQPFPVPAPAAVGILAAGFLWLSFIRRRRSAAPPCGTAGRA